LDNYVYPDTGSLRVGHGRGWGCIYRRQDNWVDLVSLFDYVGNMGQEKGLVIAVLCLENKAGNRLA